MEDKAHWDLLVKETIAFLINQSSGPFLNWQRVIGGVAFSPIHLSLKGFYWPGQFNFNLEHVVVLKG